MDEAARDNAGGDLTGLAGQRRLVGKGFRFLFVLREGKRGEGNTSATLAPYAVRRNALEANVMVVPLIRGCARCAPCGS